MQTFHCGMQATPHDYLLETGLAVGYITRYSASLNAGWFHAKYCLTIYRFHKNPAKQETICAIGKSSIANGRKRSLIAVDFLEESWLYTASVLSHTSSLQVLQIMPGIGE